MKEVFKKIKKQKDEIGYYNLAFCEFDAKQILDNQNYNQKQIAIIGIGGSSLGSMAIYSFLKKTRKLKRKLTFLQSTDPVSLNAKINKLNLNETLFILISKSGNTIETIAIFKYLYSKIKFDKNNLIIISENDSKLSLFGNLHKIPCFEIPKNVGGRFSVFSNVGLIPLYLAGFDIDNLLKGAKDCTKSFFDEGTYHEVFELADFIMKDFDKYSQIVLFSYSDLLNNFNKWFIQLFAESLGKINTNLIHTGITPISLIGPVDQHSFLQLIMEGKRDKKTIFLSIENFKKDIKIPDISLEYLEELNYINNLSFNSLINQQANSTFKSMLSSDLPIKNKIIKEISEYEIAKLMQTFMLLVSCLGVFLDINAYDQPGVEKGKIILKQSLKELK